MEYEIRYLYRNERYLLKEEFKEYQNLKYMIRIIKTEGTIEGYLRFFDNSTHIEEGVFYKGIFNRRPATEEEIEILNAKYEICKNNYLIIKDKEKDYIEKLNHYYSIVQDRIYEGFKEHRKKYMRKYRRNENGLTSREQKKQNLIDSIKSLSNEGMKQKDIADKLGINKSTVSRYLKL